MKKNPSIPKPVAEAGGSGIVAWPGPAILILCFFLSGATSLVYEVLWVRMLGLTFGHTVYAVTTVLTAFMAGLALGSVLFARFATRVRNLVGAYGWLEIGIGLFCGLIPVLLSLTTGFYIGLQRTLHLSYDAFSFVQFCLLFLLLLVPTTLMGGTLPILSQALIKRETAGGRGIGLLYAINTLGAVLGVILAGYVLLPAVGHHMTIAIAAVANLAVGALAIAYSRRLQSRHGPAVGVAALPSDAGPPKPDVQASQAPAAPVSGRPLSDVKLTLAAIAASGAVSMVYEVAWTRALALVIGSSTYAFTAMLAAFLLGIAAGSAVYAWALGTRRVTIATFGAIQLGIGLAVLLTVFAFEILPGFYLLALRRSESASFVQLFQFVVSAGVLLPSTLLIGATFPCAVAVVGRDPARVGWDVGRVYALNTVGAIAGTVMTGFVLIPALGVHASLKIGIAGNLLLGMLLLAFAPGWRSPRRWGVLGSALAAAFYLVLLPPWDQRVMAIGPAIYAKSFRSLGDMLRGWELIFYRDGKSGTVSVYRDKDAMLSLRVNGKSDASTGKDMPTQLMLGHLPLLLHRDPKAALVIGLGSGVTAGAAAQYPIERLDVVEIEPAVVEASRFFAGEHGDVLKDPRVRTVIADARNYLLTSSEQYDVIISEPSNPWIGGIAALFSAEYFQLARERLRPGGVMLQWIHYYNIRAEDLQMVVKTFRTAFPSTTIWETIPGDILLLGRTDPAPLDLAMLDARYRALPAVQPALERLGIQSWPGLFGYFLLGEEDAARFSAGADVNTDDRMQLEFSAPRALYIDTTQQNGRLLRNFRAAEFPAVAVADRGELDQPDFRYWVGVGFMRRMVLDFALAQFNRALQVDPRHRPSLSATGFVYLKMGRSADALDMARRVLVGEPYNIDALLLAGRASEELNARADAVSFLEKAVALKPENGFLRAELDRVRSGQKPP